MTTQALVPPDQRGAATFLMKSEGVVAGLPVVADVFAALDGALRFETRASEGSFVSAGAVIAHVAGPLASILSGERVALNFLQRLSGIATLTKRFVDAVEGTGARILDTRKTTPGLRALERYAVRAGGGDNHRFDLSVAVLIKDNHLLAARARGLDIGRIVDQARQVAPNAMRIEVEVTSVAEAREALEAGADAILLDNMSVEEMRQAVAEAGGRALIEASGGVALETVRAIAETGVDLISVGALTHSAPALDISLELEAK